MKNCSESYTVCTDCLKPAHFKCAIEVANEHTDGMDRNWRCIICAKKTLIITERNAAKEGLCQQAKRMKDTSEKKHPPAAIASTVRVKVPDVDRGRGDHRSILAIVLDITEDNFYKLGTRNDIINLMQGLSLVFAMRIFYPLKKFLPKKNPYGQYQLLNQPAPDKALQNVLAQKNVFAKKIINCAILNVMVAVHAQINSNDIITHLYL